MVTSYVLCTLGSLHTICAQPVMLETFGRSGSCSCSFLCRCIASPTAARRNQNHKIIITASPKNLTSVVITDATVSIERSGIAVM